MGGLFSHLDWDGFLGAGLRRVKVGELITIMTGGVSQPFLGDISAFTPGQKPGATVPAIAQPVSANSAEMTNIVSKPQIIKIPGIATGGDYAKRSKETSRLNYSVPASYLQFGFVGGGGDVKGHFVGNLSVVIPDSWSEYIGGETLIINLEVQTTIGTLPNQDSALTFWKDNQYSVLINWDKVLENVVWLASRRVFSNPSTIILVQTVYGRLIPKTNLRTEITVSFDWVTNTHSSLWFRWNGTVTSTMVIEGVKNALNWYRPAVESDSEEDFEFVSIA